MHCKNNSEGTEQKKTTVELCLVPWQQTALANPWTRGPKSVVEAREDQETAWPRQSFGLCWALSSFRHADGAADVGCQAGNTFQLERH